MASGIFSNLLFGSSIGIAGSLVYKAAGNVIPTPSEFAELAADRAYAVWLAMQGLPVAGDGLAALDDVVGGVTAIATIAAYFTQDIAPVPFIVLLSLLIPPLWAGCMVLRLAFFVKNHFWSAGA